MRHKLQNSINSVFSRVFPPKNCLIWLATKFETLIRKVWSSWCGQNHITILNSNERVRNFHSIIKVLLRIIRIGSLLITRRIKWHSIYWNDCFYFWYELIFIVSTRPPKHLPTRCMPPMWCTFRFELYFYLFILHFLFSL